MAAVKKSTKSGARVVPVDADAVVATPIVLLSGPEAFFAGRAIARIREQLSENTPTLEVHDLDAAEYTPGELLSLASPSLFGDAKLIRVHSVEKCSDAFLSDALGYLEMTVEDATLVMHHAGGNRGKALLDALRSRGSSVTEVSCAPLKKDAERQAFASAEFARLGARIEARALRSLVSAFTGGIDELAAACQQLVDDVGVSITEADVLKYFGGRVEADAFAIADAALAGKTPQALLLLRHALATGEEPVRLLAGLNLKLRTIARVHGARGSAAELARQFGLAPWQVERAQREGRRWRERDLAACIDLAAETERSLKGGSRSPEYALEKLVRSLSTASA